MKEINSLLLEHLGVEALAYLLGAAPSSISAVSSGAVASLTERQVDVLRTLEDQSRAFESGVQSSDSSVNAWAAWLLEPQSGTFRAVNLRHQATGAVREYHVPDTVEGCLRAMVADVYAELVLPLVGTWGMGTGAHNAMTTVYLHPLRRHFDDLLMADKDLRSLFPSEENGSGDVYVRRNTGLGGLSQSEFAAQTILAGLALARSEHRHVSVQHVADATGRCLSVIVEALRGNETSMPVRAGLFGVLLPEGVDSIDFGWARVRRAESTDRYLWAPTRLDEVGSVSATSDHGGSVDVMYRGDLILEFDAPYRIFLGNRAMNRDRPTDSFSVWNDLTVCLENLRLGLLLSDVDDPPMISMSWHKLLDPLSPMNGLGWVDPRDARNVTPRQLSQANVDSWKKWALAVESHREPSIGVAIRRILMAVSERSNPEDVLVDAVIVWENLFGGGGELAFRISSSLSILLSVEDATTAERVETQKSCKEIYGLRSKIVHGDPKMKMSKVGEMADKAVNASLSALREIFGNRPELLKLRDGEERSLRLIHGGR